MAQLQDFEGRRVLVTGAGAGIGRGIALRLAEAGADVACVDWNEESASAVAKEVSELGRRALALTADVSVEDDVHRVVDTTAKELGGLDVLVNNAGIVILQNFDEATLEDWDRTLSINLRSLFMTCKRALPHLRAKEGSAIVNIASMAALRFSMPHIPYTASKGGVISFTRDLAFELAPDRIRVNAVAPGPIATQITGQLSDEQLAGTGLKFVLGRIGRPADIAEAVAFLASDRASYITGVTLPVTGGADLAIRPLMPGQD